MDKLRISKHEQYKGWAFDLNRLQVDLFHLLSIFLADEKYAQTIIDDNDPLWSLASFGEPEITRILINSAVLGRVIDDREEHFLTDASCCGALDFRNSEINLTLREAFNKIIHAESFDLVLNESEEKFKHMDSTIYLHGKLYGDQWEARLNIISYIREYHRHIGNLDKDRYFTGQDFNEVGEK